MLETGLHKFVRTAAIVVALSSYLMGRAAAFDVPVTQPSPIKIAVFPFELEDFSAASQAGSAPSETTALAQSTEEAKQQLLQSGSLVRFVINTPFRASLIWNRTVFSGAMSWSTPLVPTSARP
jgi:hypothetical protein